jgi:hypothetical protein
VISGAQPHCGHECAAWIQMISALPQAFGDMLQSSLKSRNRDKAYKDLGVDRAQILLVDAGNAVLSTFSPSAQANAVLDRTEELQINWDDDV